VSRREIEQVRITGRVEADTAQLLPDPRIVKAEIVSCVDGKIVGTGSSSTATVPAEAIVRELRDADLETADGVVQLLNVLGLDLAQPVDMSGLGLIDHREIVEDPIPAAPFIVEGRYLSPHMLVAVASHGPGTRMMEGTIRERQNSYEMTVTCGHWRQVAQRLRLVRAAVNHYVAHREGADLLSTWTSEGFEIRVQHDPLDVPVGPRTDDLVTLLDSAEADAWRIFVAVHAQLLRDHLPGFTVWLAHQRASLRIAAVPSSLACALMVQLHNLVVDGLEIRRCANETCGRPFTRQRGRALKGQYRTAGVIYCDAACAKAQMQREYRRRNRQRTIEQLRAAQPDAAGRPAG
jgi:hypothetical protein